MHSCISAPYAPIFWIGAAPTVPGIKERFSKLSYSGHKKISRLPGRTAIIAFSIDEVYALAEFVRRQRGGAAIVMGSLSPKTRNAQVELYQSGDVDFLVATDAIGMGINMDLYHIYFSNLKKFDGKKLRKLNLSEIGQIAGRAGRYLNDGSFVVAETAEAALVKAKEKTGKGKPVMIVMRTEMGNGVDYMMHTHAWHGKAPNDEQLALGLAQNAITLGDY